MNRGIKRILFLFLIMQIQTAIFSQTVIISGWIDVDSPYGGMPGVGILIHASTGQETYTGEGGLYGIELPYGWSGRITPILDGWTFSPEYRDYSNITSNQTGQAYWGWRSPVTIFGYVLDPYGNPIYCTLSTNTGEETYTTTDGSYYLVVDWGWSGTVTPVAAGYTFDPPNRSYTHVGSDQGGQDYVGTQPSAEVHIYGHALDFNNPYGYGCANVLIKASTGEETYTQSDGFYGLTFSSGWSGSITPSLAGWAFNPENRTYTNLTTDATDQDFVATRLPVTISGIVLDGIGNSLSCTLLTNTGESAVTDMSGLYSLQVDYGWSGIVTPACLGYSFNPPNRSYSLLTTDQTGQNYIGLSTSGVIQDDIIPAQFRLYENYPNPFNPVTTIEYDLPTACRVTIGIYNLQGIEIVRLVDRIEQAGRYRVPWKGKNQQGHLMPSGVYIYRIRAGDFGQSRKLVLSR